MTILVIAPHADDETLGMGGTIARFAREEREVAVAVMTGPGESPHPIWPPETWAKTRSEAHKAAAVLGINDLIFGNLPAACLSETPVHEINRAVAELIASVDPEELYLPFYHDLHHDHRALAYAGIVAARAYLSTGRSIRLVSMYETPTETHLFPGQLQPPFLPNMWVDISGTLDAKIEAWKCYQSQHQAGETPRSPQALRAMAVNRGSEIGVPAAEAFMILRSSR